MDKQKPKFYLAPMVRYSKLAFRQLVRLYDVDCCYTPMIYAKSFLESEYCRSSEFSTIPEDRPLIVQFASDDPFIFASAAELVYKYSSGVDLNCGCPKGQVRSKGFGSILLDRPDHLADIVRQCRARISDPKFTISLKIRLQYPLDRTVDLCQKESVKVPVIANGDITHLEQALNVAETTGADGIMAASGLLYNPALFAGFEYTPASCVRDFLRLSADHGLALHLFQQHLIFMLGNVMTPPQRRLFHELSSRPAIEQFLNDVLLINEVDYMCGLCRFIRVAF